MTAAAAAEVGARAPMLADPNLWRAVAREQLPALLGAAAPELVAAAAARALGAEGSGGGAPTDLRALVAREAAAAVDAHARGAVAEAVERALGSGGASGSGGVADDAGSALAARLARRVEGRLEALLPAALDRWAATPAAAARLEAVAAREVRGALLAPAGGEGSGSGAGAGAGGGSRGAATAETTRLAEAVRATLREPEAGRALAGALAGRLLPLLSVEGGAAAAPSGDV